MATQFKNDVSVSVEVRNRSLVLPLKDREGKSIESYNVRCYEDGAVYIGTSWCAAGETRDLAMMLRRVDGADPFAFGWTLEVEMGGSTARMHFRPGLKANHNRITLSAWEDSHESWDFDTESEAIAAATVLRIAKMKTSISFESDYDSETDEVWSSWRCHWHVERTDVCECDADNFEGYIDPNPFLNDDYDDEDEAYLGESIFARVAREKAAALKAAPAVDPVAQFEKYPED